MRNHHRRGPLLLFMALAGLLVVGGAEPYALASRTSAEGLTHDVQLGRSLAFTISGSASRPLAPGLVSTITLVLDNPYAYSMSVTKVRVSVRSVTAPNADAGHPCTYSDFKIVQTSRKTPLTLPAQSALSLAELKVPQGAWPAIAMINKTTNQDGCKEATIALDFAGTGRRLR